MYPVLSWCQSQYFNFATRAVHSPEKKFILIEICEGKLYGAFIAGAGLLMRVKMRFILLPNVKSQSTSENDELQGLH